jgi:hypothetical protein
MLVLRKGELIPYLVIWNNIGLEGDETSVKGHIYLAHSSYSNWNVNHDRAGFLSGDERKSLKYEI